MSSSEDDDDHHSTHSETSLPNTASARPPLQTVSSSLPTGTSSVQVSQNVPTLPPTSLPPMDAISLKFSQVHDGIFSLARSIEADGDRSIATWPDLLSKYNFLVSQSHILSQTLSNSASLAEEHSADPRTRRPPLSTLPRLVLHPISPTQDDPSMDFRAAALIRTALIPDMSERQASLLKGFGHIDADHNEVVAVNELSLLIKSHDGRVSRILDQMNAFREQYDWTARVSVAPPEDAAHSPIINVSATSPVAMPAGPGVAGDGIEDHGSDTGEEGVASDPGTGSTNTSDEAFLLEAELEDGGEGVGATPSGVPSVTSETSRP
ncbi:hypothetical protein DACRYDRAFT_117867 [Dacryopinax primogenitus]|uniref:Mediator complex subunit 8 n=1 Tax=Dacryopinax primogenitus (strain DJM 731) TaxID=1858805 RepID=M5FRD2_DACPD|nr:uncharacterized protein DACRYDRAFT_117867 [Dacryopinax primogenitus]EJT99675.1 hypothetical protein DACRYDRAFT_117867 [Dacryopinax primogenitus]